MILKNQVEWALHCCALMAGLPEGEFLPTKNLADFHAVPKEYLSKALQSLSRANLIVGTLGPSGGYKLARFASKITFLDIVEAIEGKRSTFVCTNISANNPTADKKCKNKKPCTIAKIMWQADDAWRQHLRNVTLKDLMQMLDNDLPKGSLDKSHQWLQNQRNS